MTCETDAASDDRLALTINEFCRRMSVSRSLAYRMAAAGDLRLVKLGTRTVVPVSEITRLLAPVEPAAEPSRGWPFLRRATG